MNQRTRLVSLDELGAILDFDPEEALDQAEGDVFALADPNMVFLAHHSRSIRPAVCLYDRRTLSAEKAEAHRLNRNRTRHERRRRARERRYAQRPQTS
jgi:hypothetical protein